MRDRRSLAPGLPGGCGLAAHTPLNPAHVVSPHWRDAPLRRLLRPGSFEVNSVRSAADCFSRVSQLFVALSLQAARVGSSLLGPPLAGLQASLCNEITVPSKKVGGLCIPVPVLRNILRACAFHFQQRCAYPAAALLALLL